MNGFIEKWKTDSRFKAGIKLGLYLLFVICVAIFAFANRAPVANDIVDNEQKKDNLTIKIPNKYNYTIDITINENHYQYTGTKNLNVETINKIVDTTTTYYKYEQGKYYVYEHNNYVLTTKENVYDSINPVYLKLETINQYLSKSTKLQDQYFVYLKDMLLANDSEEYIVITLNENKVNINYTSLMKEFDNTITNYLVEIIIEEIE